MAATVFPNMAATKHIQLRLATPTCFQPCGEVRGEVIGP